jgi:DNA-binding transcriptional ArsR family regulator
VAADLAVVARLLASPARAAMVQALFEGQKLTAGELALVGRVGPSAASEHLGTLVKGNLLSVKRRGRNRYYELSSERVATALEAFAEICPPVKVKSLRQAARTLALRNARTCYDHLAGRLGVAIFDAMLMQRWVVQHSTHVELTQKGARALQSIGVDLGQLRHTTRAFARLCIDSTEQRPHLGGALGAALTSALFDREWIRRQPHGRGVMITVSGEAAMAKAFGLATSTVKAPSSR